MHIDTNPLQTKETHLVEPVEIMMVETTEDLNIKVEDMIVVNYTEKMKMVYPKVEEELIDFLNMCKLEGSEIMLCPRCSVIFKKEVTKDLKHIKPQQPRRNIRDDNIP